MKTHTLCLSNGYVFSDDTMREHMDILIKNNRVISIQPNNKQHSLTQKILDENTIDLDGRYILPGLIDCHVHLLFDGSPDIINYVQNTKPNQLKTIILKNLQRYLPQGITSIFDMGDINFLIFQLLHSNDSPKLIPDVLYCGHMLTAEKGHVKTVAKPLTDDENEIKVLIDEQIHHQSDMIKLIISGGILTPDTHPKNTELSSHIVKKAVNIAGSNNRKISAHVYSDTDVNTALDAGITRIQHGIFAKERTLKKAVKKDAIFTPTIKPVFDILKNKHLLSDYVVNNALELKDAIPEFINIAQNLHLKIAMGTDAGTPYNIHGENRSELQYLSKFGLETHECVYACTTTASEAIGKQNESGKIREGFLADLVVFDKNPMDDISNVLEKPYLVIKQGVIVEDNR